MKRIVEAHDRFILKVCISAQQLVLATCSIDQTIKIWSLTWNRKKKEFYIYNNFNIHPSDQNKLKYIN